MSRRGENWPDRAAGRESTTVGKWNGAVVGARKMLGWAGETAHCAGLETCPGPLQLVAALERLGVAHPGQLVLLLVD